MGVIDRIEELFVEELYVEELFFLLNRNGNVECRRGYQRGVE